MQTGRRLRFTFNSHLKSLPRSIKSTAFKWNHDVLIVKSQVNETTVHEYKVVPLSVSRGSAGKHFNRDNGEEPSYDRTRVRTENLSRFSHIVARKIVDALRLAISDNASSFM